MFKTSTVRTVGLIALAGLLAVSGSSASARAEETVITFDDLGLPDGTVITDQYADLGVLFSPEEGVLEIGTATSPIFPEDPQCLAEVPSFPSVIIADFLPSVSKAGAWIDFGNVGNGVMIEAYDGPGATGNLLKSASTNQEEFLSIAAGEIRSVRFTKVPGDQVSFCIDHFTFQLQSVDVPAVSQRGAFILLLLLLGVSTAFLLKRV